MYKFEFDQYRIATVYLYGEEVCNCGPAEVRKSQKRLAPQIANPQNVTFAGGPQII
jgi:hypothetical protein